MRIKCPTCAKLLNIPETARGKLVKCPCGKQIKVPAASQTTARAAAQSTGAAAGSLAVDPGLFDELTEADLQSARPPTKETAEQPEETSSSKPSSKRNLVLVPLMIVLIAAIGAGIYFFAL